MWCFTHSTSLSIGLLVLVSRIEKSGTGDNNLANGKGISDRPTDMTRPITVDHPQSWSQIFRAEQTKMVRSIWWTLRNFRTFGLNGKLPRSLRKTADLTCWLKAHDSWLIDSENIRSPFRENRRSECGHYLCCCAEIAILWTLKSLALEEKWSSLVVRIQNILKLLG